VGVTGAGGSILGSSAGAGGRGFGNGSNFRATSRGGSGRAVNAVRGTARLTGANVSDVFGRGVGSTAARVIAIAPNRPITCRATLTATPGTRAYDAEGSGRG
jgi:hypothetical protein